MKKLRAYLLYIMCIGFGVSCTHKNNRTVGQHDELRTITVSIEPLRYLTERIAGDAFRVVTFVPKGSSPETYEPTPEQMIDLGNSLIYIGIADLGFERTWLGRLKQTAPEVSFVNAAEGIQRMEGHRHGHDDAYGHNTDPHVWTSAVNMKIIAQHICEALCQADTAHAPTFKERLLTVQEDIQTVDDSIHILLDGISDRTFLIYHPSLTYFARDYRLEQISIENDGKEPSPHQLAELIVQCRKKNVKTIFIQQEFNRNNAMLIAKETGTNLTTINPLSYNWEKEMLRIAQTLHAQ